MKLMIQSLTHGMRAQPLRWSALAATALALLAGCADVEWTNPQAARELAQAGRPAGSPYLGWRVFQDRCARCHGVDATGTGLAPNLVPRIRTLSQREFLGLVLYRYDVTLQAAPGSVTQRPDDAQIELLMQRKDTPLVMPNWQSEPRVNAHIQDLYAYLSARADGQLAPGRPQP